MTFALDPETVVKLLTAVIDRHILMVLRRYAPSEPHGEGNHGEIFSKGKWPQNECRQTTMIARRHFLFIIMSPSSLTTLLLPWGSVNQSALPECNSNEAERLRATS